MEQAHFGLLFQAELAAQAAQDRAAKVLVARKVDQRQRNRRHELDAQVREKDAAHARLRQQLVPVKVDHDQDRGDRAHEDQAHHQDAGAEIGNVPGLVLDDGGHVVVVALAEKIDFDKDEDMNDVAEGGEDAKDVIGVIDGNVQDRSSVGRMDQLNVLGGLK